jgi:hypothetical protein
MGVGCHLVPEFKDDPLVLELLPHYLERSQRGAVYIASWLVSNGQTVLMKPTLDAAPRFLTGKDIDYPELNAACRLLLDHGTEEQFVQYLTTLRSAKVHSVGRYRQLWQIAWDSRPPRVLPILAVLLDDERGAAPGDSVRYCDFAGALLQRFSNENFGFKAWGKMPVAERNAAVARARAWMNGRTGSVR